MATVTEAVIQLGSALSDVSLTASDVADAVDKINTSLSNANAAAQTFSATLKTVQPGAAGYAGGSGSVGGGGGGGETEALAAKMGPAFSVSPGGKSIIYDRQAAVTYGAIEQQVQVQQDSFTKMFKAVRDITAGDTIQYNKDRDVLMKDADDARALWEKSQAALQEQQAAGKFDKYSEQTVAQNKSLYDSIQANVDKLAKYQSGQLSPEEKATTELMSRQKNFGGSGTTFGESYEILKQYDPNQLAKNIEAFPAYKAAVDEYLASKTKSSTSTSSSSSTGTVHTINFTIGGKTMTAQTSEDPATFIAELEKAMKVSA